MASISSRLISDESGAYRVITPQLYVILIFAVVIPRLTNQLQFNNIEAKSSFLSKKCLLEGWEKLKNFD